MKHIADFSLDYLDPKAIRIWRDSFGRLNLQVGDQQYENLRPVRAFPLSAPDRNIALMDSKNKEVGMIADIRKLDKQSRRVLEEELKMVYFMPQVRAILDVKWQHHFTTWTIETDRGQRTIQVRERGDIRTLPDGRIILTDTNGIKYEIRDPKALDERSQEFLEEEA
ncbi:MAG: DUF1854 domain-containing protein [Armatimonadota bacterium]|nr:DUF1854 domain-containing protein [Armatimonadota bacterium]